MDGRNVCLIVIVSILLSFMFAGLTMQVGANGESSAGDIGPWIKTTSLPQPMGTPFLGAGRQLVIYNERAYIFSNGYDGDPQPIHVYYSDINSDGSLGPWIETAVPLGEYYDHAVVQVGNYVYLITGAAGATAVYYAHINPGGSLDSWISTASLNPSRQNFAAVAYSEYIYATGGDSGGPRGFVKFTSVKSDGSLNSWTDTTPLPEVIDGHAMVAINGYLYVMAPSSAAYYARINSDGTVGNWMVTTSLPAPMHRYSAFEHNGYIYLLGGSSRSNYYAQILTDGSLGDWQTTTSLPDMQMSLRAGAQDDFFYAVGGYDGVNYLDAVYYSTSFYPPSEPRNLHATAGDGYVDLIWSVSSDDGGSAITKYKIYRGASSGGENYVDSISAPTTSFNDTAVTNGQTYYYHVTAVNDAGEGDPSNEVSAKPQGPPGPPLSLEAAGDDRYVTLDWNKPSVDGGAAITNYKIYRGTTSGGETLLTTVGNVPTYNDTTVINDQTYYYQASAVNSVGEGEKSEEVEVTPTSDVTTPSAPRNLQANAGDRYVNLNWNAPGVDGGAAITNYMIYRGTTSGGEKTLLTKVGNVLTYTDSDVINNRTYYYQVSAVNSAGEGAKSNEAPATPTSVPPTSTLAVTTPSAPRNLQANAGDRYVTLDWNTPSDDRGSPVTGYKVYRVTAQRGEILLTAVGNVSTYTDSAVTSGQKYYYQVSAVNSAGEGAKSNEKIVTVLGTDSGGVNIPIIAAIITALAIIAAAIINYLPPRKSKERGSISATSSPGGARVFMDGVDKGESPVTLDKVRKGTHIVLFSKSGYPDCKKEAVVNADQITPVHCDLKKPEMKLILSAEPTEIPADGKSKSVITISVEDKNGTPAPVPEDTAIVLETNIGLIDTPVSIPAGKTEATSILTSSTAGGTATVRAKSGTGLKNDVAVRFV